MGQKLDMTQSVFKNLFIMMFFSSHLLIGGKNERI